MEGRVAELEAKKQGAKEELRRFKEDYNVAIKRHKKEMAEMRRNEALAKTSTN